MAKPGIEDNIGENNGENRQYEDPSSSLMNSSGTCANTTADTGKLIAENESLKVEVERLRKSLHDQAGVHSA